MQIFVPRRIDEGYRVRGQSWRIDGEKEMLEEGKEGLRSDNARRRASSRDHRSMKLELGIISS